LPGAVGQLFGRRTGPVEHGQVQVRQRRFLGISNMPPRLDGPAALGQQQDRQVVVVVAVAVADAAAVDDHRPLQQRLPGLLD